MWNIKSKPWAEGNEEYSNIEQNTGYDWVPDQAKELMAEMNLLATYDQLLVGLEAMRRFPEARAKFYDPLLRTNPGDYFRVIEELRDCISVAVVEKQVVARWVFFLERWPYLY